MKFRLSQRFLVIYSGVLTAVFAGTVLMGATSATRDASFDQITVHRINVIEPDGTLRVTISDAAESPGQYLHGKDHARSDRRHAGIIFMNSEGTEVGGLIYGGRKGKDGRESSHGHLSFDNYDQDQTLVLEADQNDTTEKSTYLQINDEPKWDIAELLKLGEQTRSDTAAQRRAAYAGFYKTHPRSEPRVFLGTGVGHGSALMLMDREGRPRIVISVDAKGKPSLQFLDANGKAIEELPQVSAH